MQPNKPDRRTGQACDIGALRPARSCSDSVTRHLYFADQTTNKLSDNTVRVGCIVWAAGIKPSPAAAWLGLSHVAQGRVPVDDRLAVAGWPDVHADAPFWPSWAGLGGRRLTLLRTLFAGHSRLFRPKVPSLLSALAGVETGRALFDRAPMRALARRTKRRRHRPQKGKLPEPPAAPRGLRQPVRPDGDKDARLVLSHASAAPRNRHQRRDRPHAKLAKPHKRPAETAKPAP